MISEYAVLIATVAGLVTAICWGTSDWLISKSSKKIGALEINFGSQLVGTILLGVLFLVSRAELPTASQFLTITIAAILIDVAYLLMIKALSSGAVGIVVPLSNSYSLITLALSAIFLDQIFSGWQFGAMIGIVCGAALLAYEKNHRQIPLKELHKDTMLAVAAAVTWGVAYFILNPVVKEVSWQTLIILVQLVIFPIAVVSLVAARKSQTLRAMKQVLRYKAIIAIGLIGTAGSMTFYLGSDYAGSIVIPTVLSSGGPLVSSVLGAIYDHEKLGLVKRAGAVLIVGGIIVLNVS